MGITDVSSWLRTSHPCTALWSSETTTAVHAIDCTHTTRLICLWSLDYTALSDGRTHTPTHRCMHTLTKVPQIYLSMCTLTGKELVECTQTSTLSLSLSHTHTHTHAHTHTQMHGWITLYFFLDEIIIQKLHYSVHIAMFVFYA